jgi:hypothetical protein
MRCKLREDLAEMGYSVPAFELPDSDSKTTWLCEEDLIDSESHPTESDYAYVKLKNGRYVFMISVDLDWITS